MPARRLERALVPVLACTYLASHLADGSLAWGLTAATALLAVIGWAHRSEVLIGLGALLVAAAVATQLGPPWPVPLTVAVAVYVAFDRLRPAPARTAWLRRGRLDGRALIAVVVVAAVATTALIAWVHLTGASLAGFRRQFPSHPALLVLVALAFASINAITEEVAYRGVIQGALEGALGRPGLAAILQGVLFGLGHYQGVPSGVLGIALASTYGVMLGLMRVACDGLLAVWIAHVVADLTIVALIVFA